MKNSWGLRFYGRSCCILASGVIFLVAGPIRLQSQAVYGTIRGTVTTKSGEPVSGAAILVSSEQKGTKQRVTSDVSGSFTVTHLVPDDYYDIRAEASGYTPQKVEGATVSAGDEVNLRFPMEKGAATSSAQIAPTGSLLKTDQTDVSTTLSIQEVEDLPNFSRNFTNYELLAPGALPNAQLLVLRPEQNPQGGLQISQNGQHYSGSAFELDGTDNLDPINGIIVINPSLESLSEMKLTAQNFDADFGQALTGLVTAQTRSGSNRWHGSAFEFRNTDWAAASDPNLNNPNLALNPFKVNDFGGSLGGPLVRNRLFIFGDYEGNRRVFDVTTFVPVPTQKVRDTCLAPGSTNCDLSDYAVMDPSSGQQLFNIYQPQSGPLNSTACPTNPGAPFTGDIIPVCMLSPAALNLLSLLPPPNTSHSKSQSNLVSAPSSYTTSGSEPINDDEFDIRVDENTSQKLKLFGRYSFADFRIDANGSYGATAGGFGVSNDGFAGSSRSRNQDISSGFDYTLSPSLNMDFRFGFYRYHLEVFQGGLNTTPATDAGILGLNLGDKFSSGMPAITINNPAKAAGVIAFGYGQAQICSDCPLLEHEQQFQWATNWNKITGKHIIGWGGDFRYAQNLRINGERAGSLAFASQNTSNPHALPGDPATGLSLATFMLGDVTSFSRFIGSNYNAGERQNRWFLYGQDHWRPTARLSVTYGLRWEIYSPQSVSGAGNGGFLDLNTGNINVAGRSPFNLQGNVKNSFTNLAPRLGLAYQVRPKTVVRAAYGRSFDLGFGGAVFGDTVTQNLPVVAQQQVPATTDGATQFTLANVPAPTLPTGVGSAQFALPPGIAASVVPGRMRLPTIDAWNLTVQQELDSTMFLELGYVANKGTHVFPLPPAFGAQTTSYDLNEATVQGFLSVCGPGTITSKVFPGVCTTPTTSRQPYYSIYGWNQQIFYFGNNANDNYQSLQAKLEKRFKQGLQFRASYTWSKSLGYNQEYYAINPKLEYAPSSFDRTHAFSLSNIWELPIGKGKAIWGSAGSLANRIVGGWSLNTVTFAYSGLPFSPTYQNCSQDHDTGSCAPNLVGPLHITGSRNGYFTTSNTVLKPGTATVSNGAPCPAGSVTLSNGTICATVGQTIGPWQRPVPGTFGNAGVNSLRGPAFLNTNAALLKNFSLTESTRLQFRVDVENLFNRVNLGLPNTCVDCGPAGITNLASGATMRQFEFALKLQF